MISKWIILTCLLTGPVVAEQIDNVVFDLPKEDGEWKQGDEIVHEGKMKSKTVYYIPPHSDKDTTKEFFIAHVNSLPLGVVDPATLEKVIQDQLPAGQKLKVRVLENRPDSVVYEWTISNDDGIEIIHRWTRALPSKEGTVMLTYQTENIDQVNHLAPLWQDILKKAKSVN